MKVRGVVNVFGSQINVEVFILCEFFSGCHFEANNICSVCCVLF